jgi:type IV pilus assembly protein PilC
MRFNYQARTTAGEIILGAIDALNRDAAVDVLRARKLFVTSMEEFTPRFYTKKISFLQIITKKDIVIFSRQMAIMMKSKVPLTEIFQTLANQSSKSGLREKILKISEEIEGGSPLSKALSLYPKLFSTFYVNMVKSGEASGKLSDVFVYLADYLERESLLRGKIQGAMIYPGFVVVVFLAITSIMVVYVIPQLSAILKEGGQELPWITKVVMAFSDFMKNNFLIVFLAFVALLAFLYFFPKTKSGKIFYDKNLLKVPILNIFLRKMYLSRIALNLSTLVSGGLPITQCLEITSDIVSNSVYKDMLLRTRDGVKSGESMSSVLERYENIISPFFYQMVVVGEKTGTVGESLTNIVDFYQTEIDRDLDNFIKLLEPLFIVVLGLVVAGLVGAVLLPLYSVGME